MLTGLYYHTKVTRHILNPVVALLRLVVLRYRHKTRYFLFVDNFQIMLLLILDIVC
jgi:hypothetical protein